MEHKYTDEYLHKEDLTKIFKFGRDKMKRFLDSGLLPVVKMNSDYMITKGQLDDWFKKNAGKPILF